MTDDVDEILDQEMNKDRTTSEPTTPADASSKSLDEAVADAFGAIEDGDLATNITVRDENLAATFEGLEATDRLAALEQDANELVGRDVDADGTKAGLARALLRVGFSEVSPDVLDDAAAGYTAYLENQKEDRVSNF